MRELREQEYKGLNWSGREDLNLRPPALEDNPWGPATSSPKSRGFCCRFTSRSDGSIFPASEFPDGGTIMRCLPYLLIICAVLFCATAYAKTPDGETPAEESVCGDLKWATPGLYGLCVAFCEAQDCEPDFTLANPFENCKPASRKLLDNYRKKMQPGDPDMPCVSPGCPCFTVEDLPSHLPTICYIDADIPYILATFVEACDECLGGPPYCAYHDPYIWAAVYVGMQPPDPWEPPSRSSCSYTDGASTRFNYTTDEETLACRNIIVNAIESGFIGCECDLWFPWP